MNNTKKVATNTLYLTAAEILIKGVSFLWVIFLARSISVELYGRYSFVNSFVALFAVLPDFGIGLVAIRQIAKNQANSLPYVFHLLLLNSLFGVLAFLFVIIGSFIMGVPVETRLLMYIAGLNLLISALRSSVGVYFEGTENMKMTALLNGTNSILMTLGSICGYVIFGTLMSIFIGSSVGLVISVSINWVLLLRKHSLPTQFDRTIIKKLLIGGWPLGAAALAYMMYTKVDSLILYSLLDETAVAHYNASTPFVFSLLQLLHVPFIIAVYPTLSRLLAESKDRFWKGLTKTILYVLGWSLPVAIAGFIASPIVIPFLFGEKYNASIPILQVIVFLIPFAALSGLLYKILIILDKQMTYLYINLLGVIPSILLNIALISKFGVIGAAYTSVMVHMLLCSMYAFAVVRYKSDSV